MPAWSTGKRQFEDLVAGRGQHGVSVPDAKRLKFEPGPLCHGLVGSSHVGCEPRIGAKDLDHGGLVPTDEHVGGHVPHPDL